MNFERFKQIVDSYGTRTESWPEAERAAATDLIQSTGEAREYLEAAKHLDELLDRYQPAVDESRQQQLVNSIVSGTRAGLIERMINWLTPDAEAILISIWRPALAMSMPLLLGVAIGINYSTEDSFTDDEVRYLMAVSLDTSDMEDWNDE